MEWDTADVPAKWIMIPTDVAEKHRISAEKARIRRARYENTHPERNGRGAGSGTPRTKLEDKEFLVWDGEGPRDTGYSLFGNSEGMEICKPGLSTIQCLDLIYEAETLYPDHIHIWFGGNYDASNILKDLSWRHLAALHKYGKTIWRDWEIEHIPHKWMKVKRGKIVAKIFDVRSFFTGGLVATLEEWEIGPFSKKKTGYESSLTDAISIPIETALDTSQDSHVIPTVSELGMMSERQIIQTFKKLRSDFTWADIESIRLYMRLELKYTRLLMEKLRNIFSDAGYLPTSWHGPGAVARMALKRHKVYDSMSETPYDVRLAAQYAFIGGRFEPFQAGLIEDTIYVSDIHSAYPAYATQLPNLARGAWRRGTGYEPGKFAIYHIRYESRPSSYTLYPLPRRCDNGTVVWPYRVDGWYWAPEAELVANDPEATFIESHVFDEDNTNDRPFAFLHEYYRRRRLLKRIGNPAEWVFKLIINSVYGQLAQRAGWDRRKSTSPRSHQLEWAGYITSGCRAAVYRVASSCGNGLVSIDTDGVTSTIRPTNLAIGDDLGDWDIEEYDGGIFWQSGIFALRKGKEWTKAKTRGIPKGSYTPEQLLEAFYKGEPLKMTKKVFVGYGLADSQSRDKLNTWQEEPYEFVFGGTGKRMHLSRFCASKCDGTVHRLAMLQVPYGPHIPSESVRHYLPWLDTTERDLASRKHLIDDVTWYDQNHLDEDDTWVKGWANVNA